METYRVTFEYKGDLNLPDDPAEREQDVRGMIIGLLKDKKFNIIHIEPSHDLDIDHPYEYLGEQDERHCVLEIRLPLYSAEAADNGAAYKRCIEALQMDGLLCLEYALENEGPGILQSTIGFKVSEKYLNKAI